MFGRLKKMIGFGPTQVNKRPMRSIRLDKINDAIKASYDAARVSDLNQRYWARADSLAADSANSASVRATLRSRSRYEVLEANSYAKGIVLTLANHVIGRGPRLQMLLDNPVANRQIEAAFNSWSKKVALPRKLRTMRVSKAVDGEAFAMLTTNRKLPRVQLDLKLIEADQVTTPLLIFESDRAIDGIIFDEDQNPIEYHVLKTHPGATSIINNSLDFTAIKADDMIHLFRADRPGQHRGIPEITTSLPLFALLRDYTLAVLQNARTAAKFTAILETDSNAIDDDGRNWDPEVEAFDQVDVDYDMMTTMPFGWRMKQFKAEQPATNYKMFVDAILTEIARPLHMPANIARGDSSGYNYASGRLDHQTYFKAIGVEQSEVETVVLDPVFDRWFDEAVFVEDLLPGDLGSLAEIPHQWFWDGHEHVDPAKEANGQKTRIANGTTTRAREYAREGLDIDEQDRIAAETYGVTVDVYRSALFASHLGGVATVAVSSADSGDGDETENPNGESGDIKGEVDAYGVAVRAGSITPQTADENQLRTKMGLPPMSAEARAAWIGDEGVRRPTTLKSVSDTREEDGGEDGGGEDGDDDGEGEKSTEPAEAEV